LGIGGAMRVARGTDVAEWQPLSFLDPLAWFLLVAMAGGVALAVIRRERVAPAALGAFLALSVGSFVSQRFVTWAAFAAVATLPVLLRSRMAPAVDERRGIAWLNVGLVGVLAAVALGSLPGGPISARFAQDAHLPYPGSRALSDELPLHTVERLAREGYPGRIFHHQAIGGALEWTLARDRPKPVAFVDQRFELTPASLWRDYFIIARARSGFRELLDRYEVGTLLIDARDDAPLVDAVAHDAEWRLVAREFSYRLYERAAMPRPDDG
jgi:hypothetical protein